MLDVIIPTIWNSPVHEDSILSTRNIPFEHEVFLMGPECPSWPEAINAGMYNSENDVLIMDDDVVISPDTFQTFDPDFADIIGFVLCKPNGQIQHAGSYIDDAGTLWHSKKPINKPIRTVHATASLLYIKRYVIDEIGGMSVWNGFQFEDVDFSIRAIKAGFTIGVCPGQAVHHVTASKRTLPAFKQKAIQNKKRLYNVHADFFRYYNRYMNNV